MEHHKLLRADYLDILFDGRNKLYGGYELRRNYTARTRKAAALVILGAMLIATLPVIAAKLRPERGTETHTIGCPLDLAPPPMDPLPKPIEKIPELPAAAPTAKAPELRIVADLDVAEPPKELSDIKDKAIGLNDNPGDPSGITADLVGNTEKGAEQIEYPTKAQEQPHLIVEQMPAFYGDLIQYLAEHLRYPEAAQAAGEEGRVGLRFVVNEDGSISDAEVVHKASPLLDAEALRVVRNMPRWKPGRQGGRTVKVYFTLPVTFKLQ